METVSLLSWEQVKPFVPETTSVYYVDYRDSLDENLDKVEQCIHAGNYEALDEMIMDWDPDISDEIETTKNALEEAFPNFSDDQISEIMDEYEDQIREQIHDNDTSTPIDDLFRNTGKQTMFYDTGYEMRPDSWRWSAKEIETEARKIMRYLGIRFLSNKMIQEIEMMIAQASYGGTLVIYFYDNPGDYIAFEEDMNSIQFKTPVIAIIDTSGGSGDHCYLNIGTVTLPFERERLHICSNIKYSYTHSVCGMVSNWCKQTEVVLRPAKHKRQLLNSGLSEIQDKDRKYAETFSHGKCTPGDMDPNRHRNTTYINQYPCGNKCLDCGTFWID